jgi:FkbM family methyltransferase
LGIYVFLSRLRGEIKRRTLLTPLDPVATQFARGLAILGLRAASSSGSPIEARIDGNCTLTLPAGMPSARRLQAGVYEPEVTRVFRSLLTPGMTLVDIGANVGYYSLLGARIVGSTGTVFAFEPDADVYKYLVSNIRNNSCVNVIAVNKAVAGGAGKMRFSPSNFEGGFLSQAGETSAGVDNRSTRSADVNTTSLDAFMLDHGSPSIDAVKLDVEGAEGMVLAGMKEVSARSPHLRLVMEVNCHALLRAQTTLRQVTDLLIALGFRSAYVIEQGLRPIGLDHPLPSSGLIYNLLLDKQ